jgi:hypothetical protein
MATLPTFGRPASWDGSVYPTESRHLVALAYQRRHRARLRCTKRRANNFDALVSKHVVMLRLCVRMKLRQVIPPRVPTGPRPAFRSHVRTVVAETATPRLLNSPTTLQRPLRHPGAFRQHYAQASRLGSCARTFSGTLLNAVACTPDEVTGWLSNPGLGYATFSNRESAREAR